MLYLGCAITVIVEEVIFCFTEYMKKDHFALLCVATNIATNLTLNLVLDYFNIVVISFKKDSISNLMILHSAFMILTAEIIVVVIEYAIYSAAYGRSEKLFMITAGANTASFLLGILLFGIPFLQV